MNFFIGELLSIIVDTSARALPAKHHVGIRAEGEHCRQHDRRADEDEAQRLGRGGGLPQRIGNINALAAGTSLMAPVPVT